MTSTQGQIAFAPTRVLETLRAGLHPWYPASMNAVVLGGGKTDDALALAHQVPVKALIPLEGRAMAWYTLRALRESGKIDQIVYVGPVNAELEALIDLQVAQGAGMLENLEAGLQALGRFHNTERVLVVTADVPLLSPLTVREVFERDPGAALVYPIVPEHAVEAQFPGGQRTYARVREGRFTGGNLFVLEPGLVTQFMPKLRQVIAKRKNPLALAGLIGLGALLKFLLGRIDVNGLETRVSRILGVSARALVIERADIGFDVDDGADLAVVAELLKRRRSGAA